MKFLVLTGKAPTKEEIEAYLPQTTKNPDISTNPVPETIPRGIVILYSKKVGNYQIFFSHIKLFDFIGSIPISMKATTTTMLIMKSTFVTRNPTSIKTLEAETTNILSESTKQPETETMHKTTSTTKQASTLNQDTTKE